MHRLLSVSTTVVLTLSLAGMSAAQEESPAASEAVEEATATTEALPTAGWGEWDLHRQAAWFRMNNGAANAENAKAKKMASYYRALVRVYDDELQWLSNHVPEDCIAGDVAAWRAAVEELRAVGQDAAALAKKGKKGGLKKAAQQREATWTKVGALAFSDPPGDCAHAEPAAEPPVLAGKWLAKPVYVEDGGIVDKSTRKLSIGDDGKLLIQVPGHHQCRDGSRGPVTLIVKGTGQLAAEGLPGFRWDRERVDCKRKSGKGKLAGPGEEPGLLAYDPGSDVLLMKDSPECYWRADGGSKSDCQIFWRGTPAQAEGASDPEEVQDTAEPEAAPDQTTG